MGLQIGVWRGCWRADQLRTTHCHTHLAVVINCWKLLVTSVWQVRERLWTTLHCTWVSVRLSRRLSKWRAASSGRLQLRAASTRALGFRFRWLCQPSFKRWQQFTPAERWQKWKVKLAVKGVAALVASRRLLEWRMVAGQRNTQRVWKQNRRQARSAIVMDDNWLQVAAGI